MPLMEDNRMKTLLTGEGAEPLEPGVFLVSKVKIQIFDDQTPPSARMTIDAPECIFDSREKNASSSGAIALKSTDGRFSIEGEGFTWNQSVSSLAISNKVETFISRTALQSESGSGAPIRVKSDRFLYNKETNVGVYSGNVEAREGTRFKMACQRLEVELPDEQDAPQRIVASGAVEIEIEADGRQTFLKGSEAFYESDGESGNLKLGGSPTWSTDLYSGAGEQIEIRDLNLKPSFSVEGAATMTLLVAEGQSTSSGGQTISMNSESYQVAESGAEFSGGVAAKSNAGWDLSSEYLLASINEETQSVTKIVARNEVKIHQTVEGARVFAGGDRAEFTPEDGAFSDALIIGNAVVENAEFQGRADRIRLQKQGEGEAVVADGRVSVRLPRLSSEQGGFLGLSMGRPSKGAPAAEKDGGELVITSNQYRLANGVGQFEGNVVVKDLDGSMSSRSLEIAFGESTRMVRSMTALGNVKVVNPEGELSCHELEGRFSGEANRLVRLVAKDAVEFRRVNGVATGTQAVFDVVGQEVELTGDPELRTRIVKGSLTQNVLTTADVLIWDQASNTFKGRGKYRSRTLANAPVSSEP